MIDVNTIHQYIVLQVMDEDVVAHDTLGVVKVKVQDLLELGTVTLLFFLLFSAQVLLLFVPAQRETRKTARSNSTHNHSNTSTSTKIRTMAI